VYLGRLKKFVGAAQALIAGLFFLGCADPPAVARPLTQAEVAAMPTAPVQPVALPDSPAVLNLLSQARAVLGQSRKTVHKLMGKPSRTLTPTATSGSLDFVTHCDRTDAHGEAGCCLGG
jgi:hypothetical protein